MSGVEYDAESFIYVLLWAASGYDEGYDTAATQYLGKWQDDDPAHIIVAHDETLRNMPKDPENRDYGEYTEIVVSLVQVLLLFTSSKVTRSVMEERQKLPKTDRFDVKYITSINRDLEKETETDEAVKGLATRELDLPENELQLMDVRGRNRRITETKA